MTETETVHASAVALDDSGLLIIGPAGSGKSSLAIEMIAMGAELIGDDMVALSAKGGEIFAAAAPGARGQIEARNVGILTCPLRDGAVKVDLVVDLGDEETDRLPFVEWHEHAGGKARKQRKKRKAPGERVPLDAILVHFEDQQVDVIDLQAYRTATVRVCRPHLRCFTSTHTCW